MTIEELSKKIGVEWSEILNAKRLSESNRKVIIDTILDQGIKPFDNDIDLVVFGSIARNECTTKSDVDWTLLVDGQSNPNHDEIGRAIRQKMVKTTLAEPGQSGLFGQITFSHDLIHFIGGEDDTNHNLSRRILLLLESERIPLDATDSSGTAYNRVILGIIERYISNDSAFYSDHGKFDNVSRYLLNDVVRFWRTMCVDFAYKQREQEGKKWALRNIKLRMSRKLIFVKGLLMCASCYKQPQISMPEMKAKFNEIVSQKTLDFILNELLNYEINEKYIVQLLDAYNNFLAILNDDELRKYIENIEMRKVYTDKHFLEARDNALHFQDALNHIFLIQESSLKDFTLKYGLF